MKKCVACLKEKPRAAGTRLCEDCHEVWKGLHHSPLLGEGAKNRMKAKVGQHAFFKLVSLDGSQILAMRGASSSGSLVGVA
jgi:hypothetical protein